MTSAKITIDTYRCNGCGSCIEICPEVFYRDEMTEKAALISDSPDISPALQEAIAYCPEKCIISDTISFI
jgi:ferredoxin